MSSLFESFLLHENSNSFVNDTTSKFLKYSLPVLSGISIPLGITNLLVFLNFGFLDSPSCFIYFNIIIMDLLNSINGFGLTYELWNTSRDHSRNEGFELAEGYIFLLTFDVNIFLIFGLALLRISWLHLSAISVIRKLKLISKIVVGLAYLIGIQCCLNAYFGKLFTKKRRPFPSTYVEIFDLWECLMILTTMGMSVYTQIRIRLHKSKINTVIYTQASRVSFILTLNLAISYSFYLVLNAARVYYIAKDGTEKYQEMCKSPKDWVDMFLCADMKLNVFFMCLNSLVNGFVLIFQVGIPNTP